MLTAGGAAAAGCGEGLCATDIVKLPKNAAIVAEGDSLTYGLDATPDGDMPAINGSMQPRSRAPFPEALSKLLSQCGGVTNHGYPGDRSVDGLVRWQNAKPAALTLLMFGSNDALNSSHASSGTVTVETFSDVLSLMIGKRRSHGSQVLLLLPPPIQNARNDQLIETYRKAVRNIAAQQSLPLVDVAAVLKGTEPVWTTDQVHLSEKANLRIAEFLSRHIKCE